MPRYFLELSYKGTNYSGFQVQENAKTVQSEVESAFQTFYRESFRLTGSSRTDTGVHALQNFFHFDTELELSQKDLYNVNAILPPDISATALYTADSGAHSRFGAVGREYRYYIYNRKDPFMVDRGWYYPFSINRDLLHEAAAVVAEAENFIAFSKRNTQVNNFRCVIETSAWKEEQGCLVYNVKANRFLRGMVRALVSSMLKVARGTMTMDRLKHILDEGTQASADFSAPPQGLFLTRVIYPGGYMHLLK